MTPLFEISYGLIIVCVLEHGDIGHELVMQSWLLEGLDGVQSLVQHVPEILDRCGDDS